MRFALMALVFIGLVLSVVQGRITRKKHKKYLKEAKADKAKRMLWWSNFMEERAARERKIDKMLGKK